MRLKFIIGGMQRSGTTVFANMLAKNLSIPYLHEPFNPSYGLRKESADDFYLQLQNGLIDISKLRWNFDNRNRCLHRAYLLSCYLAIAKQNSFFIKCPFINLFHYPMVLPNIPIYFVYKDRNKFINDNLKRNFNFKNFLNKYPNLEIMKNIYPILDDQERLGQIYDVLITEANNNANIQLIHISKIPETVDNIVQASYRFDIKKSNNILIKLNTFGRGMMKTGSRYRYEA